MSLVGMLKGKGPTGFGYDATAEDVAEGLSLTGKTYLITGANSGLGFETLRVLAAHGAKVLTCARSVEKAREACAQVKADTVPLECELSSPASVRACIREVQKLNVKLDAIICNAGIMALPKAEQIHGIEKQLFTNHFGHFILVNGLLGQLAEDGRVVMLSSNAHRMAPKGGIEFDNLSGERGYNNWKHYGQSKFANLLFAKELARRFAGTKRVALALHPGVIVTNLGRHMNWFLSNGYDLFGPLMFKNVSQGAATQVFAAIHPLAATMNGQFLSDCNVKKPRPDAEDPELAKKFWEVSEQWVSKLP